MLSFSVVSKFPDPLSKMKNYLPRCLIVKFPSFIHIYLLTPVKLLDCVVWDLWENWENFRMKVIFLLGSVRGRLKVWTLILAGPRWLEFYWSVDCFLRPSFVPFEFWWVDSVELNDACLMTRFIYLFWFSVGLEPFHIFHLRNSTVVQWPCTESKLSTRTKILISRSFLVSPVFCVIIRVRRLLERSFCFRVRSRW